MDYDYVFEFSDYFDSEYLQDLYQNNIPYAVEVFQISYSSIADQLSTIHVHLVGGDWTMALFDLHRLWPILDQVGLTLLSGQLRETGLRLNVLAKATSGDLEATEEAASVQTTFRQTALSTLATLPYILEEMYRMDVYLSHPQRLS